MAFIIEKDIFTHIFTLDAGTQQRDNFTTLQWHNQQHCKKKKKENPKILDAHQRHPVFDNDAPETLGNTGGGGNTRDE